ncbi:hypothetical protein [Microbulbifer magnicolonia]|uniref:hypothetical protein n=1 Tax=Microbulbifer magnicolonia TaxID=3109744 RepID=UPI002B4039A9|nr:hypothetical protein [Microbulbifer sp. GG15]
MDCNQAKRELELLREQNSSALLIHLRKCSGCRDHAEELRVVRLLRSMPAPEPAEDFEERVLAAALPKQPEISPSRLRGWQLATAASLLLAVLVALPRWQQPAPATPPALAALPVSVAVDTPRTLRGATIRVSLPPNLELEGYGGSRELQWQADLNAGSNRLTLPVRLREAGGAAEIMIYIEHGGAHREFRVPVKFRPVEALPSDSTTMI